MTSSTARTYQIPNPIQQKENMNTIILPMAHRRIRRSIRRSSLAERTLPKMKNIESPIKAETGEFAAHRLPVLLSGNNNGIVAHCKNLSNHSAITV
jgi:hypothetical protein